MRRAGNGTEFRDGERQGMSNKLAELERLLEQWTSITAYERWDFPVKFVIQDPAGGTYVLRCPWDDDAEDYKSVFAIRWTATAVQDLESVLDKLTCASPIAEWPVERLEFDPATKRTEVRLRPHAAGAHPT